MVFGAIQKVSFFFLANMTFISNSNIKKIFRKNITLSPSSQNSTINEGTVGRCLRCSLRSKGICESCRVNYLKKNFTNWTSGNKIIDNFIKLTQSDRIDIIFEWIPYNQFSKIRETDKCEFSTLYLAKWKDGPLYWSEKNKKYERQDSDKSVTLKYLCSSQNNIDDFLNEV